METLPVEGWEFAHPNITTWFDDLGAALNTRDISAARDRVFNLSRHIDSLTRSPFVEVDNIMPKPEEDEVVEEDPEEKEQYEFVENDPIVRCQLTEPFLLLY
jgi:hypothetical protein